MKRFVFLLAIAYFIVPSAQAVQAQGGCALSTSWYMQSVGGSASSWIQIKFTNNTGGNVDFSGVTSSWSNPSLATFTQLSRAQLGTVSEIYWTGTSNTSPQVTSFPTWSMSPGDFVVLQFSFSDAVATGFGIDACVATITSATYTPTPTSTITQTPTATATATPTGAYTPPATPTPTPTNTPTATSVPGGTPVATTTPTPTKTPNVILSTYNGVAAIVPIWTPDPVSTSSISLVIPEIDVMQVSNIAMGAYKLLEQWKIFSTLLTILIAMSFLRWMYKFATHRDAPDPENYVDFEPYFEDQHADAYYEKLHNRTNGKWVNWSKENLQKADKRRKSDFSRKHGGVSRAWKNTKNRF